MLGYWHDEEKTAEAIDADGWMHTGDLGVMDDDGYVQITGRIKDMVIRGGENIYPREIEEFLYTHPDIEDVQVIGVPDEKYGEELCAWVRLRPGAAPLDADGVRAFADGKLARFKIPRYVMVVDEFPMTVTGKVHLMLTEDVPTFANWDQDATAVERRYAEQDPAVVDVELIDAAGTAAGLYATVTPATAGRRGVRQHGSAFTIETLGSYHLHDMGAG